MTTRGQKILSSALQLDPAERAAIAAKLLASLENEEDRLDPDEWDRVWSAEVERRIEEIDSGKTETIPWKIVRDRLQAVVDAAPS